MTRASPCSGSPLAGVLARARHLSLEERQAAERIHEAAQEAHRLTAIARGEAERGREITLQARRQRRAVQRAGWQLDTTGKKSPTTSRSDEPSAP